MADATSVSSQGLELASHVAEDPMSDRYFVIGEMMQLECWQAIRECFSGSEEPMF